jgi:small subunit ribosomal protein S16
MSVTIRLTRMGTKKKSFYRLVAADSRFPRDGRFIEVLGTYDPNPNPPAIKLNREKLETWVNRGAQLRPAKKAASAAKAGGSPVDSPA